MVNWLKHKWIYYALSVLVAVIAAYESVGLLLLLGAIVWWIQYRGFSKGHFIAVLVVGFVIFLYVTFTLKELEEPLVLPTTVTMTDTYTINGQSFRGLVKDTSGRVIYFSYQFQTVQEKQAFEALSLAQSSFYVEGELIAPEEPHHRYQFDMANYLKSKRAIGILEVSVLQHAGQHQGILAKIYDQRYRLSAHMEKVFPESLVAEAQALIIGEQDAVDVELNRAYQKLGITHLFAISGLHVALVSMLFFQGLLRLRVRRELATIVLIIVLPIYALLAGGAPSVWRSVSVVEFIMLARYFKWRLPIDDALAISFIVFVIWQPGAIYQVGFQLSYLATVSLIYSSPLLVRAKTWWMQGFIMTFVSQLITYPLLLYHFYELSLSSFVANIFFVPLFSFVILPINLLLLSLSYISARVTDFLFVLYEPLREGLTKLIMWLQDIPYQMWVAGKPELGWLLFLYMSVFLAFLLLVKQARLTIIAAVILLPALLLHTSHYLEQEAQISFINVGQGDATLIELPFRRGIYLIDTGGILRFEMEEWKRRQNAYEVGRQIVVPYLKGKGISKIDALIISHADADHIEGAEEVVKEIRIGEVHMTPSASYEPVAADLREQLQKYRIPIKEKIAGDEWQIGKAHFRYIWPTDTQYEGNNDSLVLMVHYGAFKALFTGDLEADGEQGLVDTKAEMLQNIGVLKAGHHGSKTSSTEEFVALTRPRLTIFSAGKDNRYGHPHPEVVERFANRYLPYVVTGLDGTIELIVTDTGFRMKNQ